MQSTINVTIEKQIYDKINYLVIQRDTETLYKLLTFEVEFKPEEEPQSEEHDADLHFHRRARITQL